MSAQQDFEDYIVKNRDRYTRESITDKLVETGHRREEIESAWQEIEGMPESSAQPVTRGNNGWFSVITYLIVIGGLMYLFPASVINGGLWLRFEPVRIDLVFMFTEISTWVYLLFSLRRGMSFQRATWILLTVNSLWIAVIFGTCLAPVGR